MSAEWENVNWTPCTTIESDTLIVMQVRVKLNKIQKEQDRF